MTIKRQYFIAKEWRTKTHVLTWVWHRWYRTEYEHDIYGIDDGQNLFLLKVRIWYWNVPHDKHKAMESNRLYSGHLDFYRPDDEDSSRICFIPQLDDVGTLKHFKIHPEPDQMVLIWSIVEEQHFRQAMLLSFTVLKIHLCLHKNVWNYLHEHNLDEIHYVGRPQYFGYAENS